MTVAGVALVIWLTLVGPGTRKQVEIGSLSIDALEVAARNEFRTDLANSPNKLTFTAEWTANSVSKARFNCCNACVREPLIM